MGPFIEAYLKVNDFSSESIQRARQYIQPLMDHINNQACIGGISEIFDGDYPHKPKGCFAQAWSIAELIRVRKMLYNS